MMSAGIPRRHKNVKSGDMLQTPDMIVDSSAPTDDRRINSKPREDALRGIVDCRDGPIDQHVLPQSAEVETGGKWRRA